MDKKVTGIVAYITIIGWIVAYLAGDKEGAKFHLNQALVGNLIIVACGIVSGIIGIIPIIGLIGLLLSAVVSIAGLLFMIFGIIAAANGEEKEMPIIGQIKILK